MTREKNRPAAVDEHLESVSPRECLEALVGYLGSSDEVARRQATDHLLRIGGRVAAGLALEAVSPGKGALHRLRILEVLEKVDEQLDDETWLFLFEHKARYGEDVGKKSPRCWCGWVMASGTR